MDLQIFHGVQRRWCRSYNISYIYLLIYLLMIYLSSIEDEVHEVGNFIVTDLLDFRIEFPT